MLWKQRLGHIGEKGLWVLKDKNIVDGLTNPAPEFDFCAHCIYGKDNFVQFYSSSHNFFQLMELIHFDVFGHVNVQSISKDLYYVSFIDD